MAGLLAERAASLGLSQAQFARLTGATPKHVNCVFNGKVTADPKTLDKWAGILGCEFKIRMEEI